MTKQELAARIEQCELLLDDIRLERSVALKPLKEREDRVHTEILSLRTEIAKMNTGLSVGDDVTWFNARLEKAMRGKVVGFEAERWCSRAEPVVYAYRKDGTLSERSTPGYRIKDLKKEEKAQ